MTRLLHTTKKYIKNFRWKRSVQREKTVMPKSQQESESAKLPVAEIKLPPIPEMFQPKRIDPEMLFVECARCGSPVLWEPGRATQLLNEAGIDPLELDSSCLLVTDACPLCSHQRKQYTVQIFRICTKPDECDYICGNG